MVRITRATTYIVGNPWKNWLFVRLDTDQPGLYGVGEGSLNGFAQTIEAAIHELRPSLRRDGSLPDRNDLPAHVARSLLRGWPDPHERSRRDRDRLLGHHRQGARPAHLRSARRSLPRRLPAYANGWYQGDRTTEMFAEKAKNVVDRATRPSSSIHSARPGAS